MTKALSRVEECLTFPILHFSLSRIRCCVRFGVAAAWMGETFLRLCFSGTFCWRISALYVFSLFLFLTFFYLSVVLLLVLMCFSLSCPLYVVLLSLDAFLSVSCFFVSLLLCISTFFSSFLPEFVWRVLHFHFEYMNCPFYSVFWVFFPRARFSGRPADSRENSLLSHRCYVLSEWRRRSVHLVHFRGWMDEEVGEIVHPSLCRSWMASAVRLCVVRFRFVLFWEFLSVFVCVCVSVFFSYLCSSLSRLCFKVHWTLCVS